MLCSWLFVYIPHVFFFMQCWRCTANCRNRWGAKGILSDAFFCVCVLETNDRWTLGGGRDIHIKVELQAHVSAHNIWTPLITWEQAILSWERESKVLMIWTAPWWLDGWSCSFSQTERKRKRESISDVRDVQSSIWQLSGIRHTEDTFGSHFLSFNSCIPSTVPKPNIIRHLSFLWYFGFFWQ